MASELKIFSIYKLQTEDTYYLLRTVKPGFSDDSQSQEDLANTIEHHKRAYILKHIGETHYQNEETSFDFIGELQAFPIGDKLYADSGGVILTIFYLDTGFGKPWIILGNADSEAEFLNELKDDEDLLGLKPIGEIKQISATFFTENDFDLSEIENFDTKDVR